MHPNTYFKDSRNIITKGKLKLFNIIFIPLALVLLFFYLSFTIRINLTIVFFVQGISSSGTAENQAELSPARKSTAGKYTPVRTSLLPSRKKIEPMDIESLLNDDDDDVFDISS